MIKNLNLLIFCILLLSSANNYSQVSISDKADQITHSSAVLDLISYDKGFLLPRMETNERNNIDDAAESLMIFNTETNCVETYVQGEWHELWCKDNEVFTGACEGIGAGVDYEGHLYEVVEIGDQCWFAENLRYDNGCSEVEWESNTDNGWCGYSEHDVDEQYGILYQWSVAMDVCPDGWKIPSDDDWKILEGTIDDTYGVGDPIWDEDGWRGNNAGRKLKSCRTQDHPECSMVPEECRVDEFPRWNCEEETHAEHYGTDDYGFSAIPPGYRFTGGGYNYFNRCTRIWSSDPSGTRAWLRQIDHTRSGMRRVNLSKAMAQSVRCIRDI